jgi:hypothetical protein
MAVAIVQFVQPSSRKDFCPRLTLSDGRATTGIVVTATPWRSQQTFVACAELNRSPALLPGADATRHDCVAAEIVGLTSRSRLPMISRLS